MKKPTQYLDNCVLVTGASGFIGKHLCQYLLQSNFSIRAMLHTTKSNGDFTPQDNEKLELLYCDLSNPSELAEACKGVKTVFHLAGVAHAGSSNSDQLQAVNVEGTKNLISACKKEGVQRLVFLSSILAQQCDSVSELDPVPSHYAKSKKQAEELLLDAASDSFGPAILRPVNVYGAGMKGNIAAMIRRIRSRRLPPLPRLGHKLSLLGVDDLCRAAILAATNVDASGQIYTLSDGYRYTPNTIEEAIYVALGRKKPGWQTPRVIFYAASLGAQIANNLGIWNNDFSLRTYRNLIGEGGAGQISLEADSCKKITAELGFEPTQTFFTALPSIIESLD